MNFTPPDAKQITEALGDITRLPKYMQMAVTSRLDESFQPVPRPNPNDWLGVYEEKGQTMKSFEQSVDKAVPHGTCRTIYIQPIGSFDHPRAAPLDLIMEFARACFSGCEVELLPTADFTEDMKHRIHYGTLQYRTDGFYDYLARTRSQRDRKRELVCVAITMVDIYPKEDWNFVYGEASPSNRTGVYSFARLDPLFPTSPEQLRQEPVTEKHRVIILRRCLKVLLHEVSHLFGLDHCIYYNCLMNGTNHEKEMDQQTLHMCPVCLRKLYSSLQFDIRQRYEKLADVCEKYKLEEECVWYRTRLTCIQDRKKQS